MLSRWEPGRNQIFQYLLGGGYRIKTPLRVGHLSFHNRNGNGIEGGIPGPFWNPKISIHGSKPDLCEGRTKSHIKDRVNQGMGVGRLSADTPSDSLTRESREHSGEGLTQGCTTSDTPKLLGEGFLNTNSFLYKSAPQQKFVLWHFLDRLSQIWWVERHHLRAAEFFTEHLKETEIYGGGEYFNIWPAYNSRCLEYFTKGGGVQTTPGSYI